MTFMSSGIAPVETTPLEDLIYLRGSKYFDETQAPNITARTLRPGNSLQSDFQTRGIFVVKWIILLEE